MSKILGKHIPLRKKNYVINGGCRIFQRGNNITAPVNIFTFGGADRFAAGMFGVSLSSAALYRSPMAGTVYGVGQYLASVTSTGSGTAQFRTRLESHDVKELSGKTVTVSLIAYHNASTALDLQFQLSKPNAENDWSSLTSLTVSSPVSIPSGVPTKVQYTYTIGPNDAALGLEVRPFYTVNVALSSTDIGISDIQLEQGRAATELEDTDITEEISRCQRYYEKSYDIDTAPGTPTNNGYYTSYSTSGNYISGGIIFSTAKRIAPTVIPYNPSTGVAGQIRGLTGGGSVAMGPAATGTSGFAFNLNVGVTDVYGFQWTAETEL